MIATSAECGQLSDIQEFLKIWQPKNGSNEIWLKTGHDTFYKGEIGKDALKLWETSGGGRNRTLGERIKGDGWEYLLNLSQNQDGGVFYIPTQPQGFPLKECVDATDDIGVELDGIDRDKQLTRYAEFEKTSGLKFAALLSSGGKSIHAHLKFNQHVPLDVATPIRRLTTLVMRSDPAVINVHQPMRFPGFYRREKESYQELLGLNEFATYTPEQILEGLQKCFERLRWQWPQVSDFEDDEWWRQFQRLISSASQLNEVEKGRAIRDLLAVGFTEWWARKEQERAEKQAKLQKRLIEIKQSGKFNLVDAVSQVCDEVGAEAFNWAGHDWQWSGNSKARGCCPWHESSTRSAGWISNETTDKRWLYGCTSCLGEGQQINAFEYWWRLEHGASAKYPDGKDYAIAAEKFLREHGVAVPEWNESKVESVTKSLNDLPIGKSLPIGSVELDDIDESASDEQKLRTAIANYLKSRDSGNRFQSLPLQVKIAKDFGISRRDVDELAKELERGQSGELQRINDGIDETLAEIELRSTTKDPIGTLSGFYDLDAMTGGFQRSDLIIFAGRPGMGKTSFIASCARHVSISGKKPTAIFSMEMSTKQLNYRLISSEAAIDSMRLRNGDISMNEWEPLGHAVYRLSNAPIYLDDTPNLSVAEISAKLRRLKKHEGDIGLVMIDYLQLMAGEGDNRNIELSNITRSLKGLARELNTPIIALSQLSREVEKRNNKRPISSDIRDSGSVEQDADLIGMFYRDEYYDEDTIDRGIAEVIITKHRNGPTGTVRLLFEPQFTRFLNLKSFD